jgi:hypothetical protein
MFKFLEEVFCPMTVVVELCGEWDSRSSVRAMLCLARLRRRGKEGDLD